MRVAAWAAVALIIGWSATATLIIGWRDAKPTETSDATVRAVLDRDLAQPSAEAHQSVYDSGLDSDLLVRGTFAVQLALTEAAIIRASHRPCCYSNYLRHCRGCRCLSH